MRYHPLDHHRPLSCRIFAVCFLSLLFIPAALHIWIGEETVSTELRRSAAFPGRPVKLTQLPDWARQCDRYLEDHFGGRRWLIKLNSRLRYALGESISRDVLIGTSGWLFLDREDDVLNQHRGIRVFTDDALGQWMLSMRKLAGYLQGDGISLYFIIVPNKHTAYSKYLPEFARKTGPNPTDQLVSQFRRQNEVLWLDLRPPLVAKALQAKLYDKTDTHWNDYGSFLAYQEIITMLGQRHEVHYLTESDVAFTMTHRAGDLARLLSLEKDLTEETYTAHVEHSAVIGKTETNNYQKKGWSVTTKYAQADRALILCDSFTEKYLHRFLQESFSFSHFRYHNRLLFDMSLVHETKPNIVIYIVAERLLLNEPGISQSDPH